MTDETSETKPEEIVKNGVQVTLLIPGVFDGMAGLAQGVIAFIPNRPGRVPRREFPATVDGKSVRMSVDRCGLSSMYAGTFYEA